MVRNGKDHSVACVCVCRSILLLFFTGGAWVYRWYLYGVATVNAVARISLALCRQFISCSVYAPALQQISWTSTATAMTEPTGLVNMCASASPPPPTRLCLPAITCPFLNQQPLPTRLTSRSDALAPTSRSPPLCAPPANYSGVTYAKLLAQVDAACAAQGRQYIAEVDGVCCPPTVDGGVATRLTHCRCEAGEATKRARGE